MSDTGPAGSQGSRDQAQRIRLLEARLHARERDLADERSWALAAVLVAVAMFVLWLLLW